MSAPTPRHRGNSRNRTLAMAGGLVALSGLAWLAYSNLTGSKNGGARPPGGPSSHAGLSNGESSGKANKSRGPPPSLSLSLPPTFLRTPANLRLLEQLLAQLCERFVVTLIVPLPTLAATMDRSTDLGSVVQLSDTLRHIPHFDARRLLEYSKEDGRLALVRALACDAHCEVMLQSCDDVEDDDEEREGRNASAPLFDDEDDEEDTTIDGDKTPRAHSPSPNGRQPNGVQQQQQQPNEHVTSALERYHADVGRIRKSGTLLLFLVLPIGGRRAALRRRQQQQAAAAGGVESSAASDIWLLDVETVLKPFLLPGQVSSRLPGVKIIDSRLPVASATAHQRKASRSASSSSSAKPPVKPITRAWTDAAQRLCHLADGWS